MSTNHHTTSLRSPRPARTVRPGAAAGMRAGRTARVVRVMAAAGLTVAGFIAVTSATADREPAPVEATLFWPGGGGNIVPDVLPIDLTVTTDVTVATDVPVVVAGRD